MNHPLLTLARQAIAAHLQGTPLPPRGALPPQACFVSLKAQGRLRGCVGTLQPAQPSLEAEVWANAIASATRDPRFRPVALEELDGLRLSLDLLTAPQPIAGLDGHDPRVHGLVVRWEGRSGVLLPGLPGIDDAETQAGLCRRKAGIPEEVRPHYLRFTVDRIAEPGAEP